jgi:photosystem II stability/assembly factor-like uncharacterized protein
MRIKSRILITVLAILFCFSMQGCDRKVNNKTAEPNSKATEYSIKPSSFGSKSTDCNKKTPNPSNKAVDSGPWKILNTIEPIGFSCRMAGFLNEKFGITTAMYGEVHYTTDGGENWPSGNNISDCIAGLEIIDDKTAYMSANYSEVRVTRDGGINWRDVANFGDMVNEHCRYLSFIDSEKGWIANKKEIGFTEDGGKVWKNITVPGNVADISAINLKTVDEGYILSSDGKLFLTLNGGKSWDEKNLGITGFKVLVCPTAALHISDNKKFEIVAYLEGEGQKGYYFITTSDGGNTWNQKKLIEEGGPGYINLSRNGKVLTITDAETKIIKVYGYGNDS